MVTGNHLKQGSPNTMLTAHSKSLACWRRTITCLKCVKTFGNGSHRHPLGAVMFWPVLAVAVLHHHPLNRRNPLEAPGTLVRFSRKQCEWLCSWPFGAYDISLTNSIVVNSTQARVLKIVLTMSSWWYLTLLSSAPRTLLHVVSNNTR